ncbi:MAG TPA: penicillin acylase family protein [Alphaproteobacteria bacterium]|nr:penicillin acylase family protein [Alphaproteobacteria bacterium]
MRLRTWLKRIALALLALVVAVPAGLGFVLWRSQARIDGTLDLPGLNAEARIVRDRHGIPHITAGNERDAAFALGYAHAQDRMWQMDMFRRYAAGRLSEVLGEATVQTDRFTRTLGLYRHAEASFDRLAPEVREALQGYASGVNAWLNNRREFLPPEFLALRYEPEAWRPADSLVWGKLMALQLSGNAREEMRRLKLAAKLTPAQMADLFPDADPTGPVTLALAELAGQTLAALPPTGPERASNIWVVDGKASGTGKPVLANDPHLELTAPILWYMAQVEAPGLSLAGATVPGVPFFIIGHNRRIAWGFTSTGTDAQDLFVETLDPADPGRYLTPDGPQPFVERQETIQIRGMAPMSFRVRETRHGPVVSDLPRYPAPGAGRVLALAFTALTDDDTTPEALHRLNRAEDWAGFTAALRHWVAPQQNIAYADVDGHIGLYVPGRVPVRPGRDGTVPAEGRDGRGDWRGFVPFERLPHAFDPPEGRLVNANNAVVGPGYPYVITRNWDAPYRAERIVEAIGETHGPDAAVALQLDTLSPAARQLMPLLAAAAPSSERGKAALARLRTWTFEVRRDAPEGLIFNAWLRQLHRALLADELKELMPDMGQPNAALAHRLLTAAPAWCDDIGTPEPETCQAILTAALERAVAELAERHGPDIAAWRWGDAHRASLDHQLWGRLPLADRLTDLSLPTDGDNYTVNRGASYGDSPSDPFVHGHGAGLRAVYDLADLSRSRFSVATGPSGHPLSRFYGNLTEAWRDGRTITLAPGRDAIADPAGTLLLRPVP